MKKILEELKKLSESDYKVFNDKIIATKQKTLGVRVPAMRKIAKRIAMDYIPQPSSSQRAYSNDPISILGPAGEFLALDKGEVYEMVMLEGMVLSYLDESFVSLVPHIEVFLDKVDSWAHIDAAVGNFKWKDEEVGEVWTIIEKWLRSDKEFVARAGLVMMLSHFVEPEHLNRIFALSQSVDNTPYYVHMANAWLISVCMAKYPDQTKKFFRGNTLDARTHNKAIQKSRESYRVLEEDKVLLKSLKK